MKLRRDDIAREVVYIVIGSPKKAIVKFLAFMWAAKKVPWAGKEILRDLYERGAEEVLLGVFDGLPGLEQHDQRKVAEKIVPADDRLQSKMVKRKLRGFADSYQLLQEIFETRYGKSGKA